MAEPTYISKATIEAGRKMYLGDAHASPKILGACLFEFTQFLLGYDKLTDEHHLPLCEFLTNVHASPGATTKRLVIAPRGTFKSTISTVAYPLWEYLRAKNVFNKEQEFLISSETLGNSARFLGIIRDHITKTPRFRAYFGELKPSEAGWTDRYVKLKDSSVINFDTSGVDNSRTSRHYTHRINDDLQTEVSRTPGEKKKVREFYEASQNLYHPDGTVETNVGTPYYFDDIIAAQRTGEYGDMPVYMRSAIVNEDGSPTDQYEWDAVRQKIVLLPGTKLWIPQVLPLTQLSRFRKDMGPYVFASQYLCTPRAEADQEFKQEWFAIPYTKLPEAVYHKYMLVDWGGRYRGNHYTAAVVIYVDCHNHFWIQNGFFGNMQPNSAINMVLAMAREEAVHVLAIELNTFQTLFEDEIRNRLIREAGVTFDLQHLTPHGDHKEDRIRSLIPKAAAGEIHIRRDIGDEVISKNNAFGLKNMPVGSFTEELIKELMEFPSSKYVDLLDVCGYAIRQKNLVWPPLPTVPEVIEDPYTNEERERMKFQQNIFGQPFVESPKQTRTRIGMTAPW